MSDLWWASWVLAAFGITTIFFAGKNKWWAWTIGIFTETLWVWYSIVTDQYGFIVASFAYIAVYFKNTIRWKREQIVIEEEKTDNYEEFLETRIEKLESKACDRRHEIDVLRACISNLVINHGLDEPKVNGVPVSKWTAS
jgi:hypothetical protein